MRCGFVFALHFHQPYGNLDFVFERAFDDCYEPTIELLGRYPSVSTTIHVSGPLLDWARIHRPNFIAALRALCQRGQVELLGGGDQEPMLAVIPERDALDQLRVLSQKCDTDFGQIPQGMWLAERVWEPDLARVIRLGGYRYTLLDDTHLQAAGFEAPLGAYCVTDKAEHSLAIFPIDRGLRTRIPYGSVDEVIDYLRANPGRILTYGDDAEKFGMWPTTKRRVWDEGWLERLFQRLVAEADAIETLTPSQVLLRERPSAIAYLPTISYAEMGAWALSPKAGRNYRALVRRLERAGHADDVQAFVRGGTWQGFLAKYRDSRIIYRRMLEVSAKVAAYEARTDADPKTLSEAKALLHQGQCNCAYWHGLFGGLYLQHLRAALMQALIAAEGLVDKADGVSIRERDHLGNLETQWVLRNQHVNLYVDAARGGRVFELDLAMAEHHLTGAIERVEETYHDDVHRAEVVSEEELANVSAHDLIRATETGLEDRIKIDRFGRGAFVDHWLSASAQPDDFDHGRATLIDLANRRYELNDDQGTQAGNDMRLQLKARAVAPDEGDPLEVTKTYTIARDAWTVDYRLDQAPTDGVFATQFDFTLLTPEEVGGRRVQVTTEHDGAHVVAPGADTQFEAVTSVSILADSMGIALTLRLSVAARVWMIPIETVSQSEAGFERAYQGTAIVFAWPGHSPHGFEVTIVGSTDSDARTARH